MTAALLGPVLALLLGLQGTPAARWHKVAEGVETLTLARGETQLFRFQLRRFRVQVVVTGAERPLTAEQLRQEGGALLAVNGGFFDDRGRPLGLRIAEGRTVLGLRPRVDWGVLLLREGQASIVHSRDYTPDPTVTNAIQVGPRILVDGRPTRLKPQFSRRTAVALDREGRSLTIAVTRRSIGADELAAALAELGFTSALLLDGGPSTQLSCEIGRTSVEVLGGYPVPDGLLVKGR
jgi:exopolysaccharide biosynthesis protein